MKIMKSIECMAAINPSFCKDKRIRVEVEQTGEDPIPHLHVYHDKTRDPHKCSYIRLDCAKYSEHHEGMRLPRNLKEEFIEVMLQPWSKHVVETPTGLEIATGYEAAVDIWVETYEDNDYSKFNLDDSGRLIMPDYESNL